MSLSALADALTATGLVTDAQADEGFVHGDVVLAATGEEITLNVDPDPDMEGLEPDVEVLTAKSISLINLSPEVLAAITAEVAEELEAALVEEEIEKLVDLRDDLTVVAAIALPQGAGLVFLSPTQFPEGGITVFLGETWEVEGIQLESMGGGCEDCNCGDGEHGDDHGSAQSFTSVEDVMERLSPEN